MYRDTLAVLTSSSSRNLTKATASFANAQGVERLLDEMVQYAAGTRPGNPRCYPHLTPTTQCVNLVLYVSSSLL